MRCAANSFLVVIGLIGLVTGGQHRNYFCDLPCDNGEGSVMNTVCQRQNSKCGKGQSCGPDFKVVTLNDDDRQYILDIHNYLRNKVAMGNERRGGGQPPAANMNTLTYNKELEFVAQCWINECHDDILVHDKCRRISKFSWVGQNLANMGSTDRGELEKVAMLKNLTLGWYDEVEEFHNSWVDSHDQRSVMIGHYTQLVWGDTEELGCAMSFYSYYDGSYKWYNLKLACNYGPGGNWLGQPIYNVGKAATKCAGRKSNKRFPGLCGVDVSVNQTKNYNNEYFNYHI